MTSWRGVRTVVVGSALLTMAACGGQTPTGVSESSTASTAASDGLAVRVEQIGGFAPAIDNMRRSPIVSVYSDGRAITQGPQILVYPPPAVPNLQVRRISPQDVARLVDIANGAGINANANLGRPPIADAPSTRFTLRRNGETKVLDVYALAEAVGEGSGLTKEQVAGRTKLQNLVAALTNPAETLGRAAVGKDEEYVPTNVAAVVAPWTGTPEGASAQPAIAWPGPQLPGAPLTSPEVTCTVLGGDAMAKVLEAAKPANSLTPWTSGDARWLVALRPLLPDETNCAALARQR